MTRHCLCAPTGNARSHNSIFLNAFEAQNLFQNDLDNGGFGLWYWLNVQEEKLQDPMWPMQWPSSSKVASVNLRQKMTGSKNGGGLACLICCSNNSRESLFGTPLSTEPGNLILKDFLAILVFHLLSYHPPLWKSCRCIYSHPRPQRTWPLSKVICQPNFIHRDQRCLRPTKTKT